MFSFGKRIPLFPCLLVVVFSTGAIRSSSEPVEQTTNGARIHSAAGTTTVEVCSESVIHVIAGKAAVLPNPLVPAIIRPCGGTAFTVSSDGSGLHIATDKLQVDVEPDSGAVRFSRKGGNTILAELPKGHITGTDDPRAPRNGVEQRFLLSPDEALYGLGQHQEGFLNVRDIPIRLLQANTDIAIPFLISTRGYGLLWNNPALIDFNPTDQEITLDENGNGTFQSGLEGDYGFLLSGNGRDKLCLSVNGEKVIDLKNMWLPWSAGGKMHLAANTTYKVTAESGGNARLFARSPSNMMAFRSETGDAIDYYFMYGPAPSQVIAEYRNFTGDAPLLPRWAYGFWQCRERYSSQQQILDIAAEFRKRKIPVDVIVQDWQYWGKYGWNAMRFDEDAYPDPAEMMSALHRQDFHMVISVWAKFGAETAVNREMENAHLVLTGAASTGEPGETKERENWADLFNPKAQKAFWSDIDRDLFRFGLDGWWLDASEPEGDPLKDDQTFLGPGRLVRNAYPLFETSAVYQGQRATTQSKRVVILSRSAYAGQQRNASISWSGDISANWETLRRQIAAGLSFGMSGFPYWTTDIGGFFRPADQYTSTDYHELLIRWFQFGAFCPIFRIHGFRSETEMWKYGPEVERILRQYDELRYRLLPYIYSSAWGITNRGEILMKALPFAYPDDQFVRDIRDQFMFGDSLLVNPVIEPHATTRQAVLPLGAGWVDFWTGKNYRGGQSVVADAPLDRIPIFVREGSIVPLGPLVQSASDFADPLDIRVYRGKDADFLLYEDAGDGYAYEHGERATIRLHWDDRRNTLSIGDRSGSFPGLKSERTFRVTLVAKGHGVGTEPEPVGLTVKYDGHHVVLNLGS
jgi:alpha-D-xyloside xylohydrolase